MIVVLAALLVLQSPGPSPSPANPEASPAVRKTLEYLSRLPADPERRILSGQFTDYGPAASLGLCEEVFRKTGHWPAMIGLDYADYSGGKHRLHTKIVNRVAIDYARQGGLVSISAHLPNPANPAGGGLRDRGVDLTTLLDPAHPTHQRWLAELEELADGLAELRDAGVVVLWRPFHEMNGDWFWWGGHDPTLFQKLWIQMFDRFRQDRKLDNLLWVYSPNQGRKVLDFYPGDRFVDVVGLDAYTDFVDSRHIQGYRELSNLPKPFGFTEFGPFGPSNPPGDYDYRKLLTGIEADFPRTAFFLAWHGRWSLPRNEETKKLLDNPAILNLQNLPRGLHSVR